MGDAPRLYAGIAWTADGYEAAVLDDAGHPAAPATRWNGTQVGELIAWLQETGPLSGRSLAAVVESTNGLLDGPMTAAELEVYRADPWVLPPPPVFGSVPAIALAEQARTSPASLTRLTAASGSLAGRDEDFHEAKRRGAPIRAELSADGRYVEHGRRDRPQVALTFDDGPDPVLTRRILGILERYDARATFFCVGQHAAALPEEVRRIAGAGHELGNHTWSHPFLPDLTLRQLREQVGRTTEVIERTTGRAPTHFRPPYGSQTPEALTALASYPTDLLLWDVDSRDWARPGPEQITATVLDGVGPGSVVLMHDGGGDRRQTVLALPGIIEGLLERGLEPVTVGEMLREETPALSAAARLPSSPTGHRPDGRLLHKEGSQDCC